MFIENTTFWIDLITVPYDNNAHDLDGQFGSFALSEFTYLRIGCKTMNVDQEIWDVQSVILARRNNETKVISKEI